MNADKQQHALDADFWNGRWQTGQTGWDMGQASPPITTYLVQYRDKDAAILIPGCGNAYEAAWLVAHGFTNITLLDIAPEAVRRLSDKYRDAPQVRVIKQDFFQHQGHYDLILEQTFFCALPPDLRAAYVRKMWELLKTNGRLAGVLFDGVFEKEGPPFGGFREEYEALFQPYFEIKTLAPGYNSIPPRQGSELFITLVKKEIPDEQ